jgi:ParB/RepB/Spo0J family partition protein
MAGEGADGARLPDSYDRLIPVEELHHGQHNVRQVPPRQELKNSIERRGLKNALVVRPADDGGYHVTDGWQRYQAAFELGWTELPARVFEDTLAALQAAEDQSIVREWTTFQWAQHANSLYTQLSGPGSSHADTVAEVAARCSKSQATIRRYLHALNIPSELYPLLKKRENIAETEWLPLQNYRDNIKQYDGVSWQVAAEAGKRAGEVSDERLKTTLTKAVEYGREAGRRFVKRALDQPDVALEMIDFRLFDGHGNAHQYFRVPRTRVALEDEQKEALMNYCRDRRIHTTDLIEEQVQELAEQLDSDDRRLDNYQQNL